VADRGRVSGTVDTVAIVERVKKLLALAGSPNVHEAAAAAARAQTLIEKHRLESLLNPDSTELEPVTDGRDAPLEVGKRIRKWKVLLAMALGENNGCVAYTTQNGAVTSLLLAGRESDRASVLAMWSFIVARIEWASATEGRGHNRRWHEGFRIGAAEVVAARLADAGREARADLTPTALVRVEPALAARAAAVETFVTERLRLKKGRRLLVDADGFMQGRVAGAVLPLTASDDDD
jgi:hypothetical protein